MVFRCAGYRSPFRWLTHLLHDPSERLRARFFECLGNGLESLLIGCIVKQVIDQVIETHLAMFG